MATDFLGKEIKVGDKVVFAQLQYRNLLIGEIIRLTDKTALIKHEETNTCGTQTKQFHKQLIKIE